MRAAPSLSADNRKSPPSILRVARSCGGRGTRLPAAESFARLPRLLRVPRRYISATEAPLQLLFVECKSRVLLVV